MTTFDEALAKLEDLRLVRQRGASNEQAAILAYLRELAVAERAGGHDAGAMLLERCAAAIERGAHYGPGDEAAGDPLPMAGKSQPRSQAKAEVAP